MLSKLVVWIEPNATIALLCTDRYGKIGSRVFPYARDRVCRLTEVTKYLKRERGFSTRAFLSDRIGWVVECPAGKRKKVTE